MSIKEVEQVMFTKHDLDHLQLRDKVDHTVLYIPVKEEDLPVEETVVVVDHQKNTLFGISPNSEYLPVVRKKAEIYLMMTAHEYPKFQRIPQEIE